MSEPVRVGHDPDENRDLYVLEVPSGRLEGFRSPAKRFGCFLVADATRLSDEEIMEIARVLLDAGAAYFATWGPGCERVHDLIDDTAIVLEEPSEDDVVMTTWHDDVDLDEAIWQSVYVAFPAGSYADGCNSLVAVVIDDPASAAQIRRRYADLAGLCADLGLGEDSNAD